MTKQEILDLIAEELRLEVEDNYWSAPSDITIKLMLGDRTVDWYTLHNVDILNNVIYEVYRIVKDSIGKADAEIYDLIVDLQNSENNVGWESRHTQRIDKLYDLGAIIEERSGDYLP